MTSARTTLAAALLAASAGAQADICHWTDPTGAVHYGDRAPPNVAATCDSPPPPKATAPKIEPASSAAARAWAEQQIKRVTAPDKSAQTRFESTLARARSLKAQKGGR